MNIVRKPLISTTLVSNRPIPPEKEFVPPIQPPISSGFSMYFNGYNGGGAGGLGDLVSPITTPTLIGAETNWVFAEGGVLGGYFINALGELWGCGANNKGELGQGFASFDEVLLIQIGSATNWVQAAMGQQQGYFLNSLGEIWGVGKNDQGQLGQGSTSADVLTMVQIGSATNWVQVEAAWATGYFRNDLGEIWCCGDGLQGQLGRGTTFDSYSLVQWGTASNWLDVTSEAETAYALNSLGEVWGCGRNNFAQLGLGNIITPQTNVVQVGTGSDWEDLGCGERHLTLINSVGELWTCGQNLEGVAPTENQLLVQLGSENNWVSSGGGASYGRMINAAGEIWGIGENFSGQLGIGNNSTPNYSLIQSVGGGGWAFMFAGGSFTYALK